MKTQNLYSLYHGLSVIYENSFKIAKSQRFLKENELVSVRKLCEFLQKHDAPYQVYNGYIVGYTIPQISKEFDLLRFSDDLVVNIELKGVLKENIKHQKVLSQLKKNYYYLKFLNKEIKLYTFVEDDGLYEYLCDKDQLIKADTNSLIQHLVSQKIYEKIDMENMFKPSNYLISPFNKTESFIEGEYFLTNDQETIKKAILSGIKNKTYNFFCVSASAGTGKTLLVYDLASTLMKQGKKAVIIHGGNLNKGQYKLNNKYGWDIVAIGRITDRYVNRHILDNQAIIIVDEAQRVRQYQLDLIIERALEKNIPVLFSYDEKQYLFEGEDRNLKNYLDQRYSQYSTYYKELTNKIRTNNQMSSFITNLMHIGKSKKFLDYANVTVEYFESIDQVKNYIDYISENHGWQTITYTVSQFNAEDLDEMSSVSEVKAHSVIGQEFDKVVLVMDGNFYYDEQNKLNFKKSYYSLKGMFYQIVTRVVNELKIVVLNNRALYEKLLFIKEMKEVKPEQTDF